MNTFTKQADGSWAVRVPNNETPNPQPGQAINVTLKDQSIKQKFLVAQVQAWPDATIWTVADSRQAVTSEADVAAGKAELMARINGNPEQRAVAAWVPTEPNLRVIAAAGAGKTSCSVALVTNLLDKGIDPASIIATTFTAKAGKELMERMQKVIPINQFMKIRHVGTFHKMAGDALRAYDKDKWATDRVVDGSGKKATGVMGAALIWYKVFGPAERIEILGGEFGLSVEDDDARKTYPTLIGRIARSRSLRYGSVNAEKACRMAEEKYGVEKLYQAWGLYERIKKAQNSYDFSDTLDAYYDLLMASTARSGFTVIVDEAQDNSQIQISIAMKLAEGGHIVMVGDSRQTIYSWRGAAPEMFLGAGDIMSATTKYLSTNYRSGKHIVSMGNDIVRGHKWVLGPEVKSVAKNRDGFITSRSYGTAADQARATALEINGVVDEKTILPREIAILCRTKAMQGLYEAALLGRGVPVFVAGQSSFFNMKEWKQYQAALAIADSFGGSEEIQNLSMLVQSIPGCGAKTAEKVTAMLRGNDYISAVQRAMTSIPTHTQEKLAILVPWLQRMKEPIEASDDRDSADYLARVWQERCGGAQEFLSTFHKDNVIKEDDDPRSTLAVSADFSSQFKTFAKVQDFAKRCRDNASASDPDDLNETIEQREAKREGRVAISTIHKAKGLEWDTVYVEATAGRFPHFRNAGDEMAEEEELRLFYVACTRAKQHLHLSYLEATEQKQVKGPSRFLSFADPYVGEDAAPTAIDAEFTADEERDEDEESAQLLAQEAEQQAELEAEAAPVPDEAAPAMAVYPNAHDARMTMFKDLRRAENLGGKDEAVGKRGVVVTREAMTTLLSSYGFREDTERAKGQRVWSAVLIPGVRVLVYSSIPEGAEDSRGLGEDSIKLTMLSVETDRPLLKKQPYVARTKGWRVSLMEHIIELIEKLGTACGKCGGPTVERGTVGKEFYGCIKFPECKGYGKKAS